MDVGAGDCGAHTPRRLLLVAGPSAFSIRIRALLGLLTLQPSVVHGLEADQLAVAPVVDEDLAGLELVRDQTVLPGGLQARADLDADLQDADGPQRRRVPDHGSQRFARDQLQHDVAQLSVASDIEDAHHIGVVEPRCAACPLQQLACELGLTLHNTRVQELEGEGYL